MKFLKAVILFYVGILFGTSAFANEEHFIYFDLTSGTRSLDFVVSEEKNTLKIGKVSSFPMTFDCDAEGFFCLQSFIINLVVPEEISFSQREWIVNGTKFWIYSKTKKEFQGKDLEFFVIGVLDFYTEERKEELRKIYRHIIQTNLEELESRKFKEMAETEEKEETRKWMEGIIESTECSLQNVGGGPPYFFSYNPEIGIDLIIMEIHHSKEEICQTTPLPIKPPYVFKLQGQRGLLGKN